MNKFTSRDLSSSHPASRTLPARARGKEDWGSKADSWTPDDTDSQHNRDVATEAALQPPFWSQFHHVRQTSSLRHELHPLCQDWLHIGAFGVQKLFLSIHDFCDGRPSIVMVWVCKYSVSRAEPHSPTHDIFVDFWHEYNNWVFCLFVKFSWIGIFPFQNIAWILHHHGLES